MRYIEVKGERREKRKRKRMPMSGRNLGEVYRNAVIKRAERKSNEKTRA